MARTIRAVFERTHDGATYVMIDKDIDILARALWGEEGPNLTENAASATAWTWLNRFMLHPARDKHWDYFYELIQAHSQPINPLWQRGGPKCTSNKYKNSEHCSETRLARRDKITKTPYDRLPVKCIEMAERMAAGDLPQLYDPNSVDFATTALAKKWGTQFIGGGQYYLNKKQTIQAGLMRGWEPGTVVIKAKHVIESGRGLGTALAIGTWMLMTGWAVTRLL